MTEDEEFCARFMVSFALLRVPYNASSPPPQCMNCGCEYAAHTTDNGCDRCECRAYEDPR